jgi:hypothetical protein
MTWIVAVLAAFFLKSCATSTATRQSDDPDAASESPPPSVKTIALPWIAVEGVNYEDGINQDEADRIASFYFGRFINGCGMPGPAKLTGDFWQKQLWVGIGGSYAGRFWIRRDDGNVILEPKNGKVSGITKQLLEHYGVKTD